ncbi:MAG: C69 family dipeptidase [bacterium]
MKLHYKLWLYWFVTAGLQLSCGSNSSAACFSMVVGKDASANGCVIVAHNEDDGAPQVVNHYKMPRRTFPPGAKYRLIGGGELEQPPETWAYFWSEMPGMLFSDSFVNEWGVAICSNACPSREDNPDLTEGGIDMDLRRIVAQRAKSAREGVHIAASLVERFGYKSSGRTYIICDAQEGWLFCAILGKRWLAARVPDDQVAVIANTYSVHHVDLADTVNFLASEDLYNYAATRGWYDPRVNTPFDFAVAYASQPAAADSNNFCRQWSGFRRVSSIEVQLSPVLPLSVKPEHKISISEVMALLRDHYEGTELYRASQQVVDLHSGRVNTICNETTQTSFVVQYKPQLPPALSIVCWVCLSSPCTSCYIPFYLGIPDFPAGYAADLDKPSLERCQQLVEAPFQPNLAQAFWTFSNFHHHFTSAFEQRLSELRNDMGALEASAGEQQPAIETRTQTLLRDDPAKAAQLLFDYSQDLYHKSLQVLDKTLKK